MRRSAILVGKNEDSGGITGILINFPIEDGLAVTQDMLMAIGQRKMAPRNELQYALPVPESDNPEEGDHEWHLYGPGEYKMDQLFIPAEMRIATYHETVPREKDPHGSTGWETRDAHLGDMWARDPNNHSDQWLVPRRYFMQNFGLRHIDGYITGLDVARLDRDDGQKIYQDFHKYPWEVNVVDSLEYVEDIDAIPRKFETRKEAIGMTDYWNARTDHQHKVNRRHTEHAIMP